jgi:hypothetical protein
MLQRTPTTAPGPSNNPEMSPRGKGPDEGRPAPLLRVVSEDIMDSGELRLCETSSFEPVQDAFGTACDTEEDE